MRHRAQPAARFTRNERNVLLLTGVAHTATHYVELMYPTLAVALAHETGIALEQVLTWSFAGYLLFGVGSLPAGYLADRIGARPLMIGALATMGLSSIAAGFSSPGVPLAACLAVLGLAASIYHPAGMGLISHAVAARGRALGINGIFGSVGVALTPVITAGLAARFGWQGAFWIGGAALLTTAAWFARVPIDDRTVERAEADGAVSPTAVSRVGLSFVLLCTSAMLAGISYRSNTLAQPPYFAEQVSVLGYGTATSLAFLMGVVGQYCGGIAADRYALPRAYFFFHLASLPALLLMSALSEAPLLLAAGTFTFFSLGMQPVENSLFAMLTPPRWRSTGYGVKFVLTFGVGSVGVWLVSWIQASHGLGYVFLALAGVVTLLLAVIVLLNLSLPTKAAPPHALAPEERPQS